MKRIIALALLSSAISAWALAQSAPPAAPYAGHQQRPPKALAPGEIEDLLAGHGMGLAKAAELNSYPGPSHALDLADTLQLSDAQRAAIGEIKARMSARAIELGRRLITLEGELDLAFAGGTIDAPSLEAKLGEIARVQADLRAAHLRAHLETRALLNPHQVMLYNQARGYANGAPDAPGGGHKH